MSLLNKPVHGVGAILVLVCWFLFIATSIEMTAGELGYTTVWEIGFWSPWYTYISSPTNNSWALNFFAPSFWSGVVGLWLIILLYRASKRAPKKPLLLLL